MTCPGLDRSPPDQWNRTNPTGNSEKDRQQTDYNGDDNHNPDHLGDHGVYWKLLDSPKYQADNREYDYNLNQIGWKHGNTSDTTMHATGLVLRTMKFLYRNHEFDINWIWSDVLRPQDRFMADDRGDGYSCGTVLGDDVLVIRLHQALARETSMETFEVGGSFPSPYWESVSDYRNELENNPDNGLMTETPLAPIYAYLFS